LERATPCHQKDDFESSSSSPFLLFFSRIVIIF
jgi:hypothetical protein